ncbi:MAG: class I SAM-dependent methyltransferase [Gaiellaceae bacterium]
MLLDADRAARIEAVEYDFDTAEKSRVSACNLCEGSVFTTITHSDRYGFTAQTACCTTCGLAFLDPQLTADAYADFYRGVYRPLVSAFHGRLIDARTVEHDQIGYADALVDLLAPYLRESRGRRLLDVGGSTGVVSKRLGDVLGLRSLVIDPATEEVERARSRGIEGVVGTMETYRHDGGDPFGVALICQTIDHLLDITASLAAVRRHVAEDGILFVDIVDFRAAYLRAGSVEAATKIDHPYSLTESTAEAFLARAGFRVLRKDYAADHLHVGYVCATAAPRSVLPEPAGVTRLFEEIRAVQNTRST